ncbi:DUF420 domain-containing protein [bacterium]|nr:DUF420 domain-containing protein [bacterium]
MLEEAAGNYSFFFPTFNACMNFTAAVLLFFGYRAIKAGKKETHGKIMFAAVVASAIFLSSYLYYHFNYDSYKFAGEGFWRPVYFFILISHIILAVVQLPFIFRMLWLAYKKRFQEHAKIAKWVWPAWMYTSVTGVIVYLMLYIIFSPTSGPVF